MCWPKSCVENVEFRERMILRITCLLGLTNLSSSMDEIGNVVVIIKKIGMGSVSEPWN